MKKLFLVGALALFGAMNAQSGFKLGANIGLPVGDASNTSSFTAGVDASYLWPIATDFNLGLASGYNIYFGKDVDTGYGTIKMPNLNIVPIAASGQYRFTPEFSLTVDLGYAFAFADGNSDGGFYYAPKAAYHFGPSEVNLSYRGISQNGGNGGSVNLGYAYSFGK
ncbi:outer membrane beta-barrel protein [Soonwooa sp.]|uniref:outer membrane beta-barrel protein n=1 Tax=Soonwooa sp. TaxID=1938592 RepID=UPI0026217290|nr:outer membrane beta-barrel protein [Soonwooa sp.]